VRALVVQHGEKQDAPGDPGLTLRGARQAEACAAVVASADVAAVYASPLRRALETAQRIAVSIGVDVVVSTDLRERMNWSADSGLDVAAFLQDWQRASRDRSYVPRVGHPPPMRVQGSRGS
jgi:broad specificity phosphatase PhoE